MWFKMNIDFAIVIGFLLINIVVGLTQGQKVRNIQDYALGGRNFSTSALVATLVATWVSGSMFFIDLSSTYSNGISYTLIVLGFPLAFFFSAYIFIPRMGEFLGQTSIAEAMGNL